MKITKDQNLIKIGTNQNKLRQIESLKKANNGNITEIPCRMICKVVEETQKMGAISITWKYLSSKV